MELLFSITGEARYIVIGALLGAIFVLHIISALSLGLISKICQYADLFLHVLLFSALLILGVEIETAVLLFTLSLFVYTLSRFIRYELSLKKKTSGEAEKDGKETDYDL